MKRGTEQDYGVTPNYSMRLLITGIAILATVLIVVFKSKIFGEFQWLGW